MNKDQGQEVLNQLTISVLNALRLDLRPDQNKVASFRNLLLLFQGTEEWISINKSAPWSRLVQQLLKPKRLYKLINNHHQYDLSKNFHLLNYDVLDISPNDEIEGILQRVICTLISFHQKDIEIYNPPQVSPMSQFNTSNQCQEESFNQGNILSSHFASSSSISTQILPEQNIDSQNTFRAMEIIQKLQNQIQNSQIGEYQRVFAD